MKYHIIYKTTNLINDKFYIGKHSTDNLDDGYLGSSQHLKSAIKKYGRDNFVREILVFCDSEQEAYEKEAEMVTMEVVNDPNSYNKMLGGKGSNKRVTDEEFKENRRESSRKWKEVNRERERENNRRWREANREHILERNREYRQANKERAREYYQANKESIREYRQANKERIREYQREYKREWYKANKERFLEYKREWYKANKERKQKYLSK